MITAIHWMLCISEQNLLMGPTCWDPSTSTRTLKFGMFGSQVLGPTIQGLGWRDPDTGTHLCFDPKGQRHFTGPQMSEALYGSLSMSKGAKLASAMALVAFYLASKLCFEMPRNYEYLFKKPWSAPLSMRYLVGPQCPRHLMAPQYQRVPNYALLITYTGTIY